MEKVFKRIRELNDAFVDVWEDICNIESPTSYKEGVDEVGNYCKAIARKNNWEIEVFEQKNFGDVVCITMNPHAEKEPVTISGHMDTVHPVGSFGSPAVKRDGEKIYGPGVMDCKGGIAAGFLAMQALADCGYTERPVRMLLQANEEVGSGLANKDSIRYMCEKAKDSVAFLNLEGHEDFFEGKACLKRKGLAGFLFSITGMETHASYCAKEGASAILDAAYRIIELEKIKEVDGLTFNCGVINGGSASNTVPGACEFKLDIRFPAQADLDRACKIVDEISKKVFVEGCVCTVTQTNLRVAMELVDRNIELLEKVNRALEANGLPTLEASERSGASDAADITHYGIPCLDSLGTGGGRAHSPEEFGVIDSLAESAQRIASVICGI